MWLDCKFFFFFFSHQLSLFSLLSSLSSITSFFSLPCLCLFLVVHQWLWSSEVIWFCGSRFVGLGSWVWVLWFDFMGLGSVFWFQRGDLILWLGGFVGLWPAWASALKGDRRGSSTRSSTWVIELIGVGLWSLWWSLEWWWLVASGG